MITRRVTFGVVAAILGALGMIGQAQVKYLCVYKSDNGGDGLNKICYYTCPTGVVAITIKSWELYPVNIKH